jgi:ribonuclease Y
VLSGFDLFLVVLLIPVAGAAGATLATLYARQQVRLVFEERLRRVKDEGEQRLIELEHQQRDALREAKEENAKVRAALESEVRERRLEVREYERRLQQREQALDRRAEALDQQERTVQKKEHSLAQRHDQLDAHQRELDEQIARLTREREQEAARLEQERAAVREQLAAERRQAAEDLARERLGELERIARLSRDEARREVIAAVEAQAHDEAARLVRSIETRAREDAEARAREIITLAIQRCASDQVSDVTITAVPLPNDEMKGRIIGREGRNIRAIEAATGVDLVIDDTPDTVLLSSFDPVRREVARLALTRLIIDGRIHPARIEEVVDKARQDVDAIVFEEGERAVSEANITGFPPELVKLIGRLHFRTSYGQNVLNHSIEVSVLAATIAAELGADVNVCKVAGLLHDLGKAFDQEIEGPHALISGEIARRFHRSPKIIHAIVAHHATEADPQSLEAVIVQAADAISAARPGARRETVELYLKRLEMLEQIANSFDGVERSYAVQAGREVRIIVKPEEVDEFGAARLARDIARSIEENMDYPGQIKISVVRETRSVEYAK